MEWKVVLLAIALLLSGLQGLPSKPRQKDGHLQEPVPARTRFSTKTEKLAPLWSAQRSSARLKKPLTRPFIESPGHPSLLIASLPLSCPSITDKVRLDALKRVGSRYVSMKRCPSSGPQTMHAVASALRTGG